MQFIQQPHYLIHISYRDQIPPSEYESYYKNEIKI